jgi:hypothetical protein
MNDTILELHILLHPHILITGHIEQLLKHNLHSSMVDPHTTHHARTTLQNHFPPHNPHDA